MPTLDTYRKHAKLLLRWHREGNYSVGEKVRRLIRYGDLSDRDILDMPFSLGLAQEVIAVEAGFKSWAALKEATTGADKAPRSDPGAPVVTGVIPILLVRNVTAGAEFFRSRLGFTVDFLHGSPPFYAAVSRDGVRLHLRHVGQPNFAQLAAREPSLIAASFEVSNVWALFEEVQARGADIAQTLVKQAWGGTDFHVRDPDGNVVSFVTYGQGI